LGCHCWLVQQCRSFGHSKSLLDKPAVAPGALFKGLPLDSIPFPDTRVLYPGGIKFHHTNHGSGPF